MSTVQEREAIADAYTWDLSSIYESIDDWERAFNEVDEKIDELTAYEGETVANAELLEETLAAYESLMRTVEQVSAYARMRRDEDTTDDEYQALASRGQTKASEASAAASFIEPEIQSVAWSTLEGYIETNPALAPYEHYLEDIHRLGEHTRSAEVEEILSDLGEVLSGGHEVYRTLTNADMTFPTVDRPDGDEVTITLSNFTDLQKENDRAFRRQVYEAFYDEWSTVRNAVASSLETHIKRNVKLARIRDYETAREAAMDEPNIPPTVYDTLIDTVRENLDLLHRHARLKQRSLGVDELHMWDVYMPIATAEPPTIEYEAATDHVVAAMAPLGEEYQRRVADGLESRWVDVYETKHKRSGAYSGGTYDTQPFILMNYQDTISSMFTLAHELGHSLHSELTSEAQPYVYSQYETFVAEVASTVNETLLTHHLLDTASDDVFRRHVLNEYLERFRSTLYRQTMFADFEHQLHEAIEAGEALTPDRVDERYRALKAEFYEPGVIDEAIASEWMRIPHFYYNFYVYQYSTGIAAAAALAAELLDGNDEAVTRYRSFLEGGSRKYPLALLRDAGVDMSESKPIEDALGIYEEYLDEMDSLLA